MTCCPICRQPAEGLPSSDPNRHRQGYKCSTCGRFEATHEAKDHITSRDPADRRLAGLSAYIRASNEAGESPLLNTDNWQGFSAGHLHTTVSAKLRRVLEHAEDLTSRPGEKIEIDGSHNYPLFDAASSSEVGYLVETLIERGALKRLTSGLVITAQGWERLEPSGGGGIPGTCFVAMSFKPDLNPAYDDGILPAVHEDCGIDVIRLDRVEHSENINDKILSDIRRAQFLVADFTYHPAGVYFEAGFGLGLGKLVIWTCRKDQFAAEVHFDTRPYNHILWESAQELRTKLANRIRALVPNAETA